MKPCNPAACRRCGAVVSYDRRRGQLPTGILRSSVPGPPIALPSRVRSWPLRAWHSNSLTLASCRFAAPRPGLGCETGKSSPVAYSILCLAMYLFKWLLYCVRCLWQLVICSRQSYIQISVGSLARFFLVARTALQGSSC